jgi:hypothetical protein
MAITGKSESKKIEIGQTFYAFYLQKEKDFYQYNVIIFNENWSIAWKKAIEAAIAIETDKNKVYGNSDTTAALQRQLKEACQNYQLFIKPCIEKAFINDNHFPKDRFGLQNYEKARKSVAEMLHFLYNLIDKTKKHQQELIEIGLNELKINLLEEQHHRLTELYLEKKTFEGERLQATIERRKVYAELDFFIQKTAKAAKKIYDKTDPAYHFFMIYGKKE